MNTMLILIGFAYGAIATWVVYCTWLTDKCRK